MKRLLFILSFLFINQLIAQTSDSSRIAFESSYTCDMGRNMIGGLKKGNFYMGMINLAADCNLTPTTEIYIQLQNTHGESTSLTLTNDLQVFSNIDNGDYTNLYTAWIKQQFGKLSATLGIHDLNSEFINTGFGGLFLNSSFGIQPSASMNLPVSIFPKNAPALVLNYQLSDRLNLLTAVYDGDPGSLDDDKYNLRFSIDPKKQGLLSATELQYNPENIGQGNSTIKAGLFYHSGSFVEFADSNVVKGNFSSYLIADYYFTDRLGAFAQLGYAPSSKNMIPIYVGAGLNLMGVGTRLNDVLGLAVSYASISGDFKYLNPDTDKRIESTIELTYQMAISEQINIQPDIQYIINPGATTQLKNALVSFVRININL